MRARVTVSTCAARAALPAIAVAADAAGKVGLGEQQRSQIPGRGLLAGGVGERVARSRRRLAGARSGWASAEWPLRAL
jgi:hypothetical protein